MSKGMISIDRTRGKSRDLGQLKLLGRFFRPYRGRLLAGSVAMGVGTLGLFALVKIARTLIDQGLVSHNRAALDHALVMMVAVVAVMAVATYIRAATFRVVGDRVVADLRRAAYNHLLKLAPSFFELQRTGELVSRLTTDAATLQQTAEVSLPIALRSFLQVFGGLVLLMTTSLKLTFMVFLVVLVVMVLAIAFGRRVRRLSAQVQTHVADAAAHIEQTIGAVRTVQAFDQIDREMHGFDGIVRRGLEVSLSYNMARALFFAVVLFSVFVAISSVIWLGSTQVLGGYMTTGELLSFVVYAVLVATGMGSLIEVMSALQQASGATERMFDLLNEPATLVETANPTALKPATGGRSVAFDNVTFAYPAHEDHPVIHNLSFHVPQGKVVALVGPSGAGKSTLFHLLLRLYEPQSGTITLDGIATDALRFADLRRSVALVPQDPTLFNTSVRDNIRYGRPGATDDEVVAAAQMAQADGFIRDLPGGYDTVVGERGVRLSGGQRQRISIARAILCQPDVLLLDEATSHLDAESEKKVQEAFNAVMQNRTTLVIAHRLATVKAADEIMVIDGGQVIAKGSHAALLQSCPLYKRLATLQLLDGEGVVAA